MSKLSEHLLRNKSSQNARTTDRMITKQLEIVTVVSLNQFVNITAGKSDVV